ncbi:glycoside hydrolase family 127 protein [Microbacterium sp. PRF11]|uniref:glycoside hydrolase family 127 protein n=1 Tax=Microbacterium sp. PRF11 TaxID=2962593 RepID=UPI002881318C|nr:beta-L-arabinofuranosidase domain-containing protein [Microbacterium sp. PRF11]MDT0117072.1 glycoside hydrolase family 127 protein [Microbacterium sp. PRF11]
MVLEHPLASAGARLEAVPVAPSAGRARGIGVGAVHLDPEGFWGRRQRVNASATLAHCREWMERLGWLDNFDRVAQGAPLDARTGWVFSDSEVYKLLEGMAWELGRSPDESLERSFAELVDRVARAQDDDGYLGTAFGHPGQAPRYSDLSMGHELYNMGHLVQAAVARARTGHPDDRLVEVARRAADHICREFGAGGREGVCGHAEIEVALAEAGRAFGERRYLEQADLFLTRRGRGTLPVPPLLSPEYFQDDVPVRDAGALRGHAVRALYLSAGAVDVAVDSGDDALLATLERQWENTLARRTYLTGGMGSRHQDEGFGEDWELPADRAYCETCAGVASIMFAWRLFLATGDVRYPDVIERTLFNVVATSPSADGRAFFYANPLHQREAGAPADDGVNTRAEGGVRAPWFEVSCCPTNVARTLASLASYLAAVDDEGLILLQYAAGEVATDGWRLRVASDYPDAGSLTVTIDEVPAAAPRLRLRIPAWADGATVAAADAPARAVAPGWYDLPSVAPGDVVILTLPHEPRLMFPDARIDAVRGSAAIERGPLVLCAESLDLPDGVALEDLRLLPLVPRAFADGARARAVVVEAPAGSAVLPYGSGIPTERPASTLDVTFVPYHRWAERGPSQMRVFVPLLSDTPTGVQERP